jgi:hypothetical protein
MVVDMAHGHHNAHSDALITDRAVGRSGERKQTIKEYT